MQHPTSLCKKNQPKRARYLAAVSACIWPGTSLIGRISGFLILCLLIIHTACNDTLHELDSPEHISLRSLYEETPDKRVIHKALNITETGAGIGIVLADVGTVDLKHPEFAHARITEMDEYMPPDATSHTSVNATIVVGRGQSPAIEGLAPNASLFLAKSSTASGILPYRIGEYVRRFDISVTANPYLWHNCHGSYSYSSNVIDVMCIQYPEILHVVPSGGGTQGGVHDLGMVKNALTVGRAKWSSGQQMVCRDGSQFYTQTGSYKPEIMALGEHQGAAYDGGYTVRSGVSQSTVTVAAAAALVVEAFRKKGVHEPPSSLVKSVLCCAADLMGSPAKPYPKRTDPRWGFGSLNVERAIDIVYGRNWLSQKIEAGQSVHFSLRGLGYAGSGYKVMITWLDPPADNYLSDPFADRIELNVNGRAASPFSNIQQVIDVAATDDITITMSEQGLSASQTVFISWCRMTDDEFRDQ